MNTEKVIALAKAMRENGWLNTTGVEIKELLAAILDPPAPKVDWGKAIQRRDGGAAILLGQDGDNCCFAEKRPGHDWSIRVVRKCGRVSDTSDTCGDIINVPDPPQPDVEGLEIDLCIARDLEGSPCVVARCVDEEICEPIFVEGSVYSSQKNMEEKNWTFGTWHRQKVSG